MAYCTETPCQVPARDESSALHDDRIGLGDIVVADVSISHPIMAFVSANTTGDIANICKDNKSDLSVQSTKSQMSRLVREKQQKNGVEMPPSKEVGIQPHPVVIMDDLGARTKICVMATFEGNDTSQFPLLLRRFLVPVCPTSSAEHLHTVPQWRLVEDKLQWIIAYPFFVEGLSLNVRWRDDGDGSMGSTHYRIDKSAVPKLRAASVTRARQWNRELSTVDKREEVEGYLVRTLRMITVFGL